MGENLLDDPYAMVEVKTASGNTIDINNLPGKTKMELIQSGELDIDRFVTPPNMPGKKLKELRLAHREQMKGILDKVKNEFQVGDMVNYKEKSYEVQKVDPLKGVLLTMKKGGELKDVWVSHTKVEKG